MAAGGRGCRPGVTDRLRRNAGPRACRGTRLAQLADMRGILVILAVTGCYVGDAPGARRVDPAELDLTVELGATTPVAFQVRSDAGDVTASATYKLTGAPLGTAAADGFHSNGRTGGRA